MNRDDEKEKLALAVYASLFLFLALGIAAGGILLRREDAAYWQILLVAGFGMLAAGLGLALVWRQRRSLACRVKTGMEELLPESVEQFQTLYENLSIGLYRTTPDGRILMLNPTGVRLLGYDSLNDIASRNLEETGFNAEYSRREFRKRLESQGVLLGFETEWIRKDGSTIFIRENARVVRDENGKVLYYDGSFEDITDRRQAEEKLEQFFSVNLDLLCIADLDGNFIKLNKAWESMLGYPVSELEHRKFLEFVHPDDLSATIEAMSTLGKQEQVLNFVNRYRCMDGSYRYIEWRSQPAGNLIYAAARDITERRQAEEELAHQMLMFRHLFESSPEAIAVLDPEDVVLQVNRSFESLFGYSESEARGRHINDLLAPEPYLEDAQGVSQDVFRGGQIVEKEAFRCAKDGRAVNVSLVGYPIIIDQHVIGAYAIYRDISERKRAEEELKRNVNFTNTLLDAIPTPVFYKDREGMYLGCNRTYTDLIGVTSDEIQGKTVYDLWPGELAHVYHRKDMELMENSSHQVYEFEVRDKDGMLRPVIFAKDVFRDAHGEVAGMVGAFIDITERKRAEEALKENEAIFSSFLEHSPVYVFFKDRDIRALRLSRNYEQMLGMPLQDLLGKSMDDLFPSELAKSMVADDQRILNEGRRITVVEELNGRVYETTKFPVLKDGEPYILAGFTLDITERKHAEEALRESEARFRTLFEQAAVGVAEIDTNSGRFLRINQKYCDILGYTRREMLDLDFQTITHPDDLDADLANMERLVAGDLCEFSMEKRYYRKNGDVIWVLLTVSPLWEMGDLPTTHIAVVQDVTSRRQAEEALRLSEARWQFALEGAGDGVWDWDVASNRVFFSRQWKAMLGYDENEIPNALAEWDTRLHPQDRSGCYAALEAHIKGETPDYRNEHRLLCKDGTYKWILDRGRVIERNSDGTPRRVIGTHTDITERKQMQDALTASEERLDLAMSVKNEGIWDWNLKTNRVDFDDRYYTMAGYSPGEFPNKLEEFQKRIHPEDVDLVMSAAERYLAGQIAHFNVEFRFKPKSDSWIWIQGRGIIVARDENGAPLRFIGTHTDITARKQAEVALRESERLYRKMNENSPMGMHFYKSNGGRLVFSGANPAADKLLGVDNSQFIGKTIEEAFPPLAQTEVPQRYREAAENGILWSTEQVIYDDGRISGAFEVKAFQTTPGNMVAVFADITARKQAQEEIHKLNTELEQRVRVRTAQLENTNRELEAFSYSVSHDLRAPLRGIDGWSQALLEDYHEQLDEQGRQYIERVRSETQRMGYLIDDLLSLSRLTRAEMTMRQVDLSALAQSIAGRLMQDDPQRQVDFIIQPGVTAEGDQHLLEAALSNLLGNAFKFTGKCSQAQIEFGQSDVEGKSVFFVRDNGVGFDMAYAQKLFGAFQRLHKASEFPGTGVGLAIVQRIIHRHGGRIWAEAEVGKGAVFNFTLKEDE